MEVFMSKQYRLGDLKINKSKTMAGYMLSGALQTYLGEIDETRILPQVELADTSTEEIVLVAKGYIDIDHKIKKLLAFCTVIVNDQKCLPGVTTLKIGNDVSYFGFNHIGKGNFYLTTDITSVVRKQTKT